MDTNGLERKYWENFYLEHFGLTVQFDTVVIPPRPIFDCGLKIFPQELTKSIAIEKCNELFKTRIVYSNLGKDIPRNARTAQHGHYAAWIEDSVNPCSFLGQPVMVVDPHKKIGTTFLEQTLMEIEHFIRTGNHLNCDGMTLCSGSRFADGGVPGVRFNHEGFSLCWIALAQTHPKDGIRRVSA